MKSPITKLAAAAVAIAIVVLGLFEFIDTENKSGVVWGEVVKKVEASRGLIYRNRSTHSKSVDLEGEDGPDYSMNYFSAMYSRSDTYKGGQIIRSFYQDYEAMTGSAVYHTVKHFIQVPLQEDTHKYKELTNPKWLLQKILSCQHKKLGTKTIEGVLCEGLDTTDPAFFGSNPSVPTNSIDARLQLWVSVETNYPVLFEGKVAIKHDGNVMSSAFQLDQFQWDVELDPSLFDPNIPSDYEQM